MANSCRYQLGLTFHEHHGKFSEIYEFQKESTESVIVAKKFHCNRAVIVEEYWYGTRLSIGYNKLLVNQRIDVILITR